MRRYLRLALRHSRHVRGNFRGFEMSSEASSGWRDAVLNLSRQRFLGGCGSVSTRVRLLVIQQLDLHL